MANPPSATFRIGQLARLSGASVPTIRFYEQQGPLEFGKHQLQALREKLVALKALEEELAQVVDSCESTCCGGPVGDCTITMHLGSPGAAGIAK